VATPAARTPREPASQPAIRKAKGRPKIPVPTTETIIFPSVWILEAVPVDEDSSRGIVEIFNSSPISFFAFSWLPERLLYFSGIFRRLFVFLFRDERFGGFRSYDGGGCLSASSLGKLWRWIYVLDCDC